MVDAEVSKTSDANRASSSLASGTSLNKNPEIMKPKGTFAPIPALGDSGGQQLPQFANWHRFSENREVV